LSVDFDALFARIAGEIPADLLNHLYIAGSLAAACHYAGTLTSHTVRTKDADLVIHPAGDTTSARSIAERLLAAGWRRKENCAPRDSPVDELDAIRLYPPTHSDYFVEFLNLPSAGQHGKRWLAVELDDGWYGIPSFEFLSLTSFERERTTSGVEYATPAMMALANLLSHPSLGSAMIGTLVEGRSILRSAKDLGRVLALAWLEGRSGTEAWLPLWRRALKFCFPDRWQNLAGQVGSGLRELLGDDDAFEQAFHSCAYGLLVGKNVELDQLRAAGERLLVDVIGPLEEQP
jgi:hypothetical protein